MEKDRATRTTLDIDDDILQAAKEIAANRATTTGRILSDLARKALVLLDQIFAHRRRPGPEGGPYGLQPPPRAGRPPRASDGSTP